MNRGAAGAGGQIFCVLASAPSYREYVCDNERSESEDPTFINPFLHGLRAIWHAAIFRVFSPQDDASYSSHLVLDLVTPMPSTN